MSLKIFLWNLQIFFQAFVSSFYVLSVSHSIWLTSFRCLLFNTNWAKCPFWFELWILVLLTSVLVLISFLLWRELHQNSIQWKSSSLERISRGQINSSTQSTLDSTVFIKLLHTEIFFIFWFDDWLLRSSFSLKSWSFKVRYSMKSLNCGKVCVECFHAQRGRKMIFLKMNFIVHTKIPDTEIDASTSPLRPFKNMRAYPTNSKFGSSSHYISFWSWWCLSSFLQNSCLYDIRKKLLRIHQSYLLPGNKRHWK